MKIKTKLVAGFFIILLLLVVNSYFSWNSMAQLGRQTTQLKELEASVTSTLNSQVAVMGYLEKGDQNLLGQARTQLGEAKKSLDGALSNMVIPEQLQRGQNAKAVFPELQKIMDAMEARTNAKNEHFTTLVGLQAKALEAINTSLKRTGEIIRGEYLERRLDALLRQDEAKEELYKGRVSVRAYMANPTEVNAQSTLEQLSKALALLDEVKPLLAVAENLAFLAQARESLVAYIEGFKQYAAAQADLNQASGDTTRYLEGIIKDFQAMTTFANKRFVEVQETANTTTLSLSILAVVLGALIAMVLVLAVTRPIAAALRFAQTVAGGNFSARWETQSSDEMGILARELNTAFGIVAEKVYWFENILDAIHHPVSVTDSNMNWTFLNKSCMQAIGAKKREDVIGKACNTWGSSICKTQQCGIECLKRAANGFGSSRFSQNSGSFTVDSSYLYNTQGKVIGHIELVNDVTEQDRLRKEADEAVVRGRLDTVASLEGIVERLSTASEQLSAQIEESDRGANQVAHRMSETATAMEEMNATVLEVARNAGDASSSASIMHGNAKTGAGIVENVIAGMRKLRGTASGLKTDMAVLEEQAESIGQIMTTISDIADQTNLLALNAAIEAARAGDAGRGFAVVADEVRKLAEKTQQATAEVGTAITRIQQATRKNMDNVDIAVSEVDNANSLATESGSSLGQIVSMAEQASDKVRAIATAAEEQSAASEEINQSIENVSAISGELSSAMNQASAAIAELSHQASQLRQVIDKLKNQ